MMVHLDTLPTTTLERARALVERFQDSLGLWDWTIDVTVEDDLNAPALTNYVTDKQEAVIRFRRPESERDDFLFLPYLAAHEVAHLLLMRHDRARGLFAINRKPEVVRIMDAAWLDADEYTVHNIARGLGVVMPPPNFWWSGLIDSSTPNPVERRM